MASPAKKIILLFLTAVLFFSSPAVRTASAQEDVSSPASSSTGLIEKIWKGEIVPALQSCWNIAVTVYEEGKKFITGQKDIFSSVKWVIGNVCEEYRREMDDLKQWVPEVFKGQIEWFKTFSDNWYNP